MRRTLKSELPEPHPEIRMNPNYTSLIGVEEPFDIEKEESKALTKNRILRTQTYINKLSAEVISPNLITPPNCRYMERFNEGVLVVVEQPPAIRTICVNLGMRGYIDTLKDEGKLEEYGYENFLKENRPPYYFTLAFPFMIFMFAISNSNEILEGRVACRTKQISGPADMLFKVPLNNITRGDHVCWPQAFHSKRASVYSATNLGVKAWWTSIFNSDYSYNANEYKETDGTCGLGNYLEWNYMTKLNPLFIYNAKWIRLRKLGPTLEEMISSNGFTSLKNLDFEKFKKLFRVSTPTGELVKPHKRARKKQPLFYDICQSAYLSPNILVSVGDKFKYKRYKKKYAHVESYLGVMGTGRPTHIVLDVEGRSIKMKLNQKVKKYIAIRVTRYQKQTKATINGVEIKKGDLIKFKGINGQTLYKKVEYIQKTIDGQIEVKARESYLASNMEDVEIVDTENLELAGTKLEKDKEYLILPDSYRQSMYHNVVRAKFDSIGADRHGLYFEFIRSTSYGSYKLRGESKVKKIFNLDELPVLQDNIFYMGRKLFRVYGKNDDKDYVWHSPNGIFVDRNIGIETAYWNDIKNLINDDTFHVKGAFGEVTFKVGDLVVVSDWETPLNMLSIKKLIGFEINDDTHDILFILQNKNEEVTKYAYIKNRSAMMHGTVRKVATSHENFNIGTKLISNTNDFPGFPEGSVNIAVAIITDTGNDEPLVLCSNCQTLWLDDIYKHFTKVKRTSKRWETLDHADFDPEDIKFQAGDIVEGISDYKSDGFGYVVAHRSGVRYLSAFLAQYFTRYPESYEIDGWFGQDMIFDSIIMPRYPKININETKMEFGWPNYHGLIYGTSEQASDMMFPAEYGRVINVQSVCE